MELPTASHRVPTASQTTVIDLSCSRASYTDCISRHAPGFVAPSVTTDAVQREAAWRPVSVVRAERGNCGRHTATGQALPCSSAAKQQLEPLTSTQPPPLISQLPSARSCTPFSSLSLLCIQQPTRLYALVNSHNVSSKWLSSAVSSSSSVTVPAARPAC
jgi:hypothetical protein